MRGGAFLKGKEGRVGFRKNTFFNGKEGRDDFRNPSLMVKKYGYVFEKIFFLKRAREFRKQPSFPFKNS